MKNLDRYDALVAKVPGLPRKGKTNPYTSDNGYMFSHLNKDGELGIRLPKEVYLKFREQYNATEYRSHGAVMREYVKVPDEMFEDLDALAGYLKTGWDYVKSLPPK